MSDIDDADDGFEEILRDQDAKVTGPCTMRCAYVGIPPKNGERRRRISLTLRSSLLPPEVLRVLNGPRFSVAYSAATGTIRLRACEDGAHQITVAPGRPVRPSNEARGGTFLMRFPFPARGMRWCEDRVVVEVDANEEQRIILIDVPASHRAEPPRCLPQPKPLAIEPPRAELDPEATLRAVRYRARAFPRTLAGRDLGEDAALLLGALYANDGALTVSEMLAATHNEDRPDLAEREESWVARTIATSRTALHAIGVRLTPDSDGACRLIPQYRQRVRELLIADGHEA